MNIINIFKIVILVCFISIQIYHLSTEHFFKYPCLSWGNFKKTPFITFLWVIIVYFSVYVIFYNNVLQKKYIWIMFILINLLIIFSNFDYSSRKNEDNPSNIFSYIHHVLSFITLVFSYIIIYPHNTKFMNMFVLSLLIVFFTLHQIWYKLHNKTKKKILKHVSTMFELVIFVLILGKGLLLENQ